MLKSMYRGWLMKQDIKNTNAMALPLSSIPTVERAPTKAVWQQMKPNICHFSCPKRAQKTQTEIKETAGQTMLASGGSRAKICMNAGKKELTPSCKGSQVGVDATGNGFVGRNKK